jgi:hypothetical protein
MRGKVLQWGLSVLTMVSVATAVLLVTGWGSAMAASVSSVFVTNTSSNPVPVNGSVNVGNFPSTQAVSGSVNVGNTNTNPVNVSVGNFPSTQAVSGSVNVGNFPATQTVSGSVNVANLPTDGSGNLKVAQQGTANVNVTNTTLKVSNEVPTGGFSFSGSSGEPDCPAGNAVGNDPGGLPAGTKIYITSFGFANNSSSPAAGGLALVQHIIVNGQIIPAPVSTVLVAAAPANSTSEETFTQPFVVTTTADHECVRFTENAGTDGFAFGTGSLPG